MKKEDLFKKRREALEKKKYGYKTLKASYLIVTEGRCTEPNYFNGLTKEILANVGGKIEVVIRGMGFSPHGLIEYTEQYVNRANNRYKNVWVVFDKDDFEDFDQAIKEGEAKGYHVAWSNQSFEYWIYLHFNYRDTDQQRCKWIADLKKLFKTHNLSKDGYEKNIENLYELLKNFKGGGIQTAIKNAKKRMAKFDSKIDKPSKYVPGTTVYILVEELRKYLED